MAAGGRLVQPQPVGGALARATGLTVRALHYYDEIGLLEPSLRTASGHRLYDAADVGRLYRISLLRRLGFPLDQIAGVLQNPEWQLLPAVDAHLSDTQNRAAIAARLCSRLATVATELARQDDPSPEQLFSIMEEMTMLDGTIHSTTGLLIYDDVDAAHDYLVRVFGLTSGHVEANSDGHRRGPPAVRHPSQRDVRVGRDGQAYGIREYGARDLEGQLWFFQSPLG